MIITINTAIFLLLYHGVIRQTYQKEKFASQKLTYLTIFKVNTGVLFYKLFCLVRSLMSKTNDTRLLLS